jgi:FdrA protein
MLLAVDADNAERAEKVLDEAVANLTGKKSASGALGALEGGIAARPRSLRSAIRQSAETPNLVFISLPGAYVEAEAMTALKNNLHLFVFSDNVPVEAEIRLKTEAVKRGLLCMGPDCGTAWLNGKGIGFCNAVPRGRVGVISASGTGLQSVACLLAANGEGLSHGIGVGGRDLSREVGGLMTLHALDMLDGDPQTEIILILSKPPAEETMARLTQALRGRKKPIVMACLGLPDKEQDGIMWASTISGAAQAVLARLRGGARSLPPFGDAPVAAKLAACGQAGRTQGGALLGLYTGGTLAHEADILIRPLLGDPGYGDEDAARQGRHCILDLGDDRYTQGRPHPMIDPQPRVDMLRALASGKDGVPVPGVVLFDLVLGACSHHDPAGCMARAIDDIRARLGNKAPVFVASVVGTDGDEQGLAGQIAKLEKAGVVLLPDNAQAVRFAALCIKPELRTQLFGN